MNKDKVIERLREAEQLLQSIRSALLQLETIDNINIPEYARTIQMNNEIERLTKASEEKIIKSELKLKDIYYETILEHRPFNHAVNHVFGRTKSARESSRED